MPAVVENQLWCAEGLRIQVTGPTLPAEGEALALPWPFARIGRLEAMDVKLVHPDISRCHAYLHRLPQGIFFVDLGSRAGLEYHGRPVTCGWIEPGVPLVVGKYELMVETDQAGDETIPLERRHEADNLLGVTVQLTNQRAFTVRRPLTRVLTILGSGKPSNLQIAGANIYKAHAALYRTETELWFVNLVGGRAYRNNDRLIAARIEHGDVCAVGGLVVQFGMGSGGFAGQSESPTGMMAALDPARLDESSVETAVGEDDHESVIVPDSLGSDHEIATLALTLDGAPRGSRGRDGKELGSEEIFAFATERESLERRIQDLEAEVERLRCESVSTADLAAEAKAAAAEADSQRARLEEMRKSKRRVQDELERLKASAVEASARADEEKLQAAEWQSRHDVVMRQLETSKRDGDDLRKWCDNAALEVEHVRKECERLDQLLEQEEQKVLAWERKCESIQLEKNMLEGLVARANDFHATADTQLQALRQQCDALQREREVFAQERDLLALERQRLVEKIEAGDKQWEELSARLESERTAHQQTLARFEAQNGERAELASKITELLQRLAESEKSLGRAAEKHQSDQKRIAALEADVSERQGAAEQMRAEIEQLRAVRDEAANSAKIASRQDERLFEQDGRIAKLQSELETAERERTGLIEERDLQYDEIDRLTRELINLTRERDAERARALAGASNDASVQSESAQRNVGGAKPEPHSDRTELRALAEDEPDTAEQGLDTELVGARQAPFNSQVTDLNTEIPLEERTQLQSGQTGAIDAKDAALSPAEANPAAAKAAPPSLPWTPAQAGKLDRNPHLDVSEKLVQRMKTMEGSRNRLWIFATVATFIIVGATVGANWRHIEPMGYFIADQLSQFWRSITYW